ncbi:MAG: universal stress protein [Alphaproteobacteria bacterium]|nr:universal stress protein [Alphaproteobacteria bacterium]MDX5368569.1 universal stress protein [Alphaproteobacteria bacterium]MDX5463320.1 universal stress protein [Alphaproteobacteria bacterium]
MYRDILLPVDLAHTGHDKPAIDQALKLAETFGAKLHVMSVLPDYGMSIVGSYFPPDFEKKGLKKADEELHAFVKRTVPEGMPVQHIVAHGTVYKEIVKAAKETGCDLIVMTPGRSAFEDFLIGPNAARVMRHAPCSVLLVRG